MRVHYVTLVCLQGHNNAECMDVKKGQQQGTEVEQSQTLHLVHFHKKVRLLIMLFHVVLL